MGKRTCSKGDCREPTEARGLCKKHYGDAYRNGTLPPRQMVLGIHSLSNVDRDASVADCAVCGPQVPIRIVRSGMQCRVKRREGSRGRVRASTPEVRHRDKLRTKYGLTPDDYAHMVITQDGRCAICGAPFEGPYSAHVDHDHASGRIRGLLCRPCNIALGFLRDNPAVATAAARYLLAN
jgi:hypothetical protein